MVPDLLAQQLGMRGTSSRRTVSALPTAPTKRKTYHILKQAKMHRSPAHCIEYVHLIQWGQERPSEDFDADVEEHMAWVFGQAATRAQQYGIQVPSLFTGRLAAC